MLLNRSLCVPCLNYFDLCTVFAEVVVSSTLPVMLIYKISEVVMIRSMTTDLYFYYFATLPGKGKCASHPSNYRAAKTRMNVADNQITRTIFRWLHLKL